MPDLTQLALYFAAALVLPVTPGPGIFYVAARTLAGGRAEMGGTLAKASGTSGSTFTVRLPITILAET